MKILFVWFSLTLGVALGAGESYSLITEGSGADGVEERRAEAMGKKFQSFETMKGRIYEDVKITEINDGGISFTHAAGAARLRFEDLSPEQRRYFGITEDAAVEFYRKEREARLAYEKRVKEAEVARRKAAEEEAEVRRVADEQAAQARAERSEALSFRNIPTLPEVKRVDSRDFSRRSYTIRRSSYGYPSYYYSSCYPRFRSYQSVSFGWSRGYCGSRTAGFVIRR